jgi:predicted methyltransferase MtxX (methanogen marker protein 4)
MITDRIIERARMSRARIAIGAEKGYEKKVIESAEKAEEMGYASVVVVSRERLDGGIENIVSASPEAKLVDMLKRGEAAGIVRGSLDINPIMNALKEQFGIRKLLRLAILQPPHISPFVFAPVGIDDAWGVREKVRLGQLGAGLMRRLGIEENIAVLGGGRKGDIGRSAVTDRSIRIAEKTADALTRKGYRATCMYILFEEAIQKYNFILAPDGISGNLIYRSLCLVGEGSGMGGPAVGVDFVYVDTSRAGRTYHNAICCASALSGLPQT